MDQAQGFKFMELLARTIARKQNLGKFFSLEDTSWMKTLKAQFLNSKSAAAEI
jgi:hypothetical protein